MEPSVSMRGKGLFIGLNTISVPALLMGLLVSCLQWEVNPPPYFQVQVQIRNSAGTDLLNPNTPGAYKFREIVVQHKIQKDGTVQIVSYTQPSLLTDSPSLMEVGLLTSKSQIPIETYIALSATDTDTITYTFDASPRFLYLPGKMYYNRQLIWDTNTLTVDHGAWPVITIVK